MKLLMTITIKTKIVPRGEHKTKFSLFLHNNYYLKRKWDLNLKFTIFKTF